MARTIFDMHLRRLDPARIDRHMPINPLVRAPLAKASRRFCDVGPFRHRCRSRDQFMPRHHSILISPGRFPSPETAYARPGHPKPRILSPRGGESGSWALKEAHR